MTREFRVTLCGVLLAGLTACHDDVDGDSEADADTGHPGDAGSDQADSADHDAPGPDLRDSPSSAPVISVSSDFESGSIGSVQHASRTELSMNLRNDNDDPSLPANFRAWWYVRFDHVPVDEDIAVTVGNLGWPFLQLPVYSYDQEVWYRMAESEVSRLGDTRMQFVRSFEQPTVWIASFYPYTHTDLQDYLDRITDDTDVRLEAIGETREGRDIEMLTITDVGMADTDKSRIWLHARSHPAENGSSFLLEGLIDFLLSEDPDAQTALANFVFNIVPMHNVDGVIAGNYRTTTSSENLESMWFYDPENPWELLDRSPAEVHVLRDAIADFSDDSDPLPITVALNLHSSNGEPDLPTFFYPHFGPVSAGYSADEAQLWNDSIAFVEAVSTYYGAGLVAPPPAEGGASFTTRNFPETWWWLNFGPEVMAITLETVYGRAGFAPDWVTDDDIRDLGEAVGLALLDYHDLPMSKREPRVRSASRPPAPPAFPELYPPDFEDEGKE